MGRGGSGKGTGRGVADQRAVARAEVAGVVPAIADPTIDWLARYHLEYTDIHCYQDGAGRRPVCETDRRVK